MPDSNHPSGIRVPYGPEANVVPQDFTRFREDLSNLISYPVASKTERNTKLGNMPAGTRAHSIDGRYQWIKTGTSATAWDTTYYKSGSSGGGNNGWNVVPMLNNYSVGGGRTVAWKRREDTVYWRGMVAQPDDYTPGSYLAFCDVPAEAQPMAAQEDQLYPLSANQTTFGGRAVVNYNNGQMRMLAGVQTSAWWSVSMVYDAKNEA